MQLELKLHQPFNLEYTLQSGQTFRWRKVGRSWFGVLGSAAVKVTQIQGRLVIEADEKLDEEIIRRYFGLDDDILGIYDLIDKDQHIHAAIKAYRGLRILRQDPWETLVSFIAATYTSIKRIVASISNLSQRYGLRKKFYGEVLYTFPTPQAILQAGEEGLRKAGLGYRAKWIAEAANIVKLKPYIISSLAEQHYESARAYLLYSKPFKGVGDKVADCILLFGFGKLQAFPIDRWIRRSVIRNYSYLFDTDLIAKIREGSSLSKVQYNTIRLKMINYYGRYAGYAQQYLFTYERSRSLGFYP